MAVFSNTQATNITCDTLTNTGSTLQYGNRYLHQVRMMGYKTQQSSNMQFATIAISFVNSHSDSYTGVDQVWNALQDIPYISAWGVVRDNSFPDVNSYHCAFNVIAIQRTSNFDEFKVWGQSGDSTSGTYYLQSVILNFNTTYNIDIIFGDTVTKVSEAIL